MVLSWSLFSIMLNLGVQAFLLRVQKEAVHSAGLSENVPRLPLFLGWAVGVDIRLVCFSVCDCVVDYS